MLSCPQRVLENVVKKAGSVEAGVSFQGVEGEEKESCIQAMKAMLEGKDPASLT